jgi:hypothetical protein
MGDPASRRHAELTRILEVYESLGYPRATVTQWSLPATDVADLWALAERSGARRVLEVGMAGATSTLYLAEALRASVTGALTELNIAGNSIKDEGITAICNAVQSNKLTKLNVAGNNISPVGATAVAAMVAVTGGLTSINLSYNQLCGVWRTDRYSLHGTYTAEGIAAIADAMRVNGALTKIE